MHYELACLLNLQQIYAASTNLYVESSCNKYVGFETEIKCLNMFLCISADLN